MKMLLWRGGVFLLHKVKKGKGKAPAILFGTFLFLLFVCLLPINMLSAFVGQGGYLNEDFDVGKTKTYQTIQKAYEQFMQDTQTKMDQRERELIEEHTTYIDVSGIENQNTPTPGSSFEEQKVCTITVNKTCNGFSFAYILAYINFSTNVLSMETCRLSEEEIYRVMEKICEIKEMQSGASYALFTDIKTKEEAAKLFYPEEKDVQEQYCIAYDVYEDFLRFAKNTSVFDTDENNGLNVSHNTSISEERAEHILSNIPPDQEIARAVVAFAINALGTPYSQAKRTSGSYYDCSSLCFYAYQSAGLFGSIWQGYPPTAAELARYVRHFGTVCSFDAMEAGDLIFYNFGGNNGRYLGIEHVGIYIGNGLIIDASSSKGYVVQRPVYGRNSVVLCGRPYA